MMLFPLEIGLETYCGLKSIAAVSASREAEPHARSD